MPDIGMVAAIAGPTPEEYAAKVGGDAKIVPSGELAIDGRKVICGKRPTVLDNKLDDYGAAYPGFLILIQVVGPGFHACQALDLRSRVWTSVSWPG